MTTEGDEVKYDIRKRLEKEWHRYKWSAYGKVEKISSENDQNWWKHQWMLLMTHSCSYAA
jgi:hypothetical protein